MSCIRHVVPSLATAVSLLVFSPAALSQEALAEDDPKAFAHAASQVAEGSLSVLAAELRGALRRTSGRTTRSWVSARRCLFDALIRRKVPLTPEDLLHHAADLPTEALILAARAPETHETFLRELVAKKRTRDYRWMAAANLLLRNGSRAFVADLLQGIELRLSVSVSDDGTHGASGRRSTFASACGAISRPAGYPPIPFHVLHTSARNGALLVAPGPTAIWASRRVVVGKSRGIGGRRSLDRERYRRRLLDSLLATPLLEIGVPRRRSLFLDWVDEMTLRARVDAELVKLDEAFSRVLTELVVAGRLDAEVAPRLTLRLKPKFHDRRYDRTRPLPTLDAASRSWRASPR